MTTVSCRSILSASLLSALSCTSLAAQLLPAVAGDRIPPAPVASRSFVASADLDRTPVAFSWRVDSDSALSASPPHRAESREFWLNASAVELREGVRLSLTAPGAVIRISPVLADRSSAVDPTQLELSRNGVQISAETALRSVIKPSDLADGAVPFPEGSSAFRLAEEIGSGAFELRAPDASGGRYVIQVLDAGSRVSLSLQADHDTFFAGESLQATASLTGAAAGNSSALLTGPDGSTQQLSMSTARDGSQRINSPLTLPALGAARGLYELHVWTAGGDDQSILRDVRTAFALAAPTARLGGEATAISIRGSTLAWQFDVQVAQAGRYQLEATLHVEGKPFATAQSAAWLEAGQRQLQLGFDSTLFEGKTPKSFELRDVRLVDQGQLVTLERRALALASKGR